MRAKARGKETIVWRMQRCNSCALSLCSLSLPLHHRSPVASRRSRTSMTSSSLVPSSAEADRSWTAGAVLPSGVVARLYDVALAPSLDTFTFAGHVRISITVQRPTRSIVANSLDLTYPAGAEGRPPVQLLDAAGSAVVQRASSLQLDDASQRVRIEFADEIPAGDYTLAIAFNGVLNDLMVRGAVQLH